MRLLPRSDEPSRQVLITSNSNELNSTLVIILLMGVYSVVYGGTLYVYMTQKTMKNPVIVSTLSALYFVILANVILQWWITQQAFVIEAESRFATYVYTNFGDAVYAQVCDTLQILGYLLADGLLLWRCFHMVSGSLKWMVIPIFLYICETGFGVTALVFEGLFEFQPKYTTESMSVRVQVLLSSLSVATAVTSLSATYIICRRIQSSTDINIASSGRFKRIISILIQTAALYSTTGVLFAIVSIMDSQRSNLAVAQRAYYISEYVVSINIIMTGVAPTLMVAQIALATSKPVPGIQEGITPSTLMFDHQTALSFSQSTSEGQDVEKQGRAIIGVRET